MAATEKPSSTSDSGGDQSQDGQPDGRFECNICFEQATDAVVSKCGHLFCWPCIHRWMEARSENPTCPVCKSVIDRDRLIPLYGRGSTNQADPRDKVPPRPRGQREEAPQQNEQGFGMEGINVSFGIGAFPFTMLGGPALQMFGNRPPQGNRVPPQVREQQQRMARVLITIALLMMILIIFS